MIKRENTKYIFLHTAAYKGEFNSAICTSWHMKRGWSDAGYHVIIGNGRGAEDGEIQYARPLELQGAGVKGCNKESVHICLAGHGDHEFWTDKQKTSLKTIVKTLQKRYDIPTENVYGHRECYKVNRKFPTDKSCPGNLIEMNAVRWWLDNRAADVNACEWIIECPV